MRLTKKMQAVAAGLAACALALAGCGSDSGDGSKGSGSGELKEVKFGYIADFNGSFALAVAEEKGLWEKHGLKADTPTFTNGPLQIQALGTKDIDFGYIGPGAMWLPASGEADVAALNALGDADRVIAQPGISTMADLKGKKVGVVEGTSGDTILTLALEEAGMSSEDIERVPMDPGTVVSAFSAGQIDAAGIWYPHISTIKQSVPDLTELAGNEEFREQNASASAFVVRSGLRDEDPAMYDAVVQVLREALDFRAENLDETVKITADFLQGDEQQIKDETQYMKVMSASELDKLTEDGTIESWLDGMADQAMEAGKFDAAAKVPASEFYLGDDFVEAGK